VLAASMVVCLHYFYFAKNKIQRGAAAIAGALTANGLVLINSRGAFLASTVSIAYYVIMLYRNPLKLIAKKAQIVSAINLTRFRKTKVALLICVGLIAVVSVSDDAFVERIQTIVISDDPEKESGSTRMHFWGASWEMAKDHPLGLGIGGFEQLAPYYIPEDINTGRSRNRAVHSSYFEILSEVGYLGLAAFLFMLYGCFKLSKATRATLKQKLMEKQYFQVVALEGMLISFMTSAIFINRSRAVVLYWFIAFICAAYCIYVVRQDKLEPQTK
jgi:O-antigen ligase